MSTKIKGQMRLQKFSPSGKIKAAIKAAGGVTPDWELLIYGDIGDSWDGNSVTAKDVVQQLQGVKGGTLLQRINSYGGSVSDGTAIYNAVRNTGAYVISRVEGVAASIASLIAMAGDRVEMFSNTLMMIHAPWTFAGGNSADLRQMADVLDTYAAAMATSYARQTGRTEAEELALLTDGKDHWFTAADALASKYATAVIDSEELDTNEAAARAEHVLAAMARYKTAPAPITASLKPHWAEAILAKSHKSNQIAAPAASTKESLMNWKAIAKALSLNLADDATEEAVRAAVAKKLGLTEDADEAAISEALGAQAHAALSKKGPANPGPANQTREEKIEAMFAIAMRGKRKDDAALATLRDALLISEHTEAQARELLLKAMGNGASPLAADYVPHVSGGEDQIDKRRAAMTSALLARAGRSKEDGANEFRGMKLGEMARASLELSGFNTRGMSQIELASAALGMRTRAGAANTTSDFPVILENTMHKLVLSGYAAASLTWMKFCKKGIVTDFREWKRLVPGAFGNFDDVNEAGEYKIKNIPDATANGITAKRKGNIIRITPETLINDDLGYITDTARGLGAAGGRTVETAAYTVLSANPTLKDGVALFHANHGNLAASGGVPSVSALDAGRQAMAIQTAPGDGTVYLGVTPSIGLAHTTIEGAMRVIVGSGYDPDAANKLQRMNMVQNLVGEVVGSPRVASGAWYLFANPEEFPVIEVAFLDGQDEPVLLQDDEFSTGGIAWRAELPFGAGAIDYRGAYKNAGS